MDARPAAGGPITASDGFPCSSESPAVVHQYVMGNITVNVQGVGEDPAETVRQVKAELIRSTLASTGRDEDA